MSWKVGDELMNRHIKMYNKRTVVSVDLVSKELTYYNHGTDMKYTKPIKYVDRWYRAKTPLEEVLE